MTDQEFHYEMAAITLSQRDGHLNYQMPVPHFCNAAIQAPRFTVVNEKDWFLGPEKEKIVISALNTSQDVIKLSPDSSKISVDNQVLKVDGVPTRSRFF
jgi:hypothetical protein